MAKLVLSEAGQLREVQLSESNSLGRSQDSSIVIAEPKASRKHCEIYKQAEQWFVKDLASSNGTRLDGNKIETPTFLKQGSRITIGVTEIIFQEKDYPDADADLTGSVIGGYLIEKELGRGGMGAVYKALQLSMNRAVAVKVLKSTLGADREFVKSFLREARLAGKYTHPGLVPVFDVGEYSGILYFSMELVTGKTFDEIVSRKGPLPPAVALRYVSAILDTLEYLHSNGVYHLDIKPQNIMVTPDDRPRLMDLGLSFSKNIPGMRQTRDRLKDKIIGSPGYMAPEQADPDQKLDGRADLYSLACSLYHITVGVPPFGDDKPFDVLERNLTSPRPVARDADPKLPAQLSDMLLKGMSLQKNQRSQSAREFHAEIDALLPRLEQLVAKFTGKQKPVEPSQPMSGGKLFYSFLILLNIIAVIGAIVCFILLMLDDQNFMSLTNVSYAEFKPPPDANPPSKPPENVGNVAVNPPPEKINGGNAGNPDPSPKIAPPETGTKPVNGGSDNPPDNSALEQAGKEIKSAMDQAAALYDSGDRIGARTMLSRVLQKHRTISSKLAVYYAAEEQYNGIVNGLNETCQKAWMDTRTYSVAGRYSQAKEAAGKAIAADPQNKYSQECVTLLKENDTKTQRQFDSAKKNISTLLAAGNFDQAVEKINDALNVEQLDGTRWGSQLRVIASTVDMARSGYDYLREQDVQMRVKIHKTVMIAVDGKSRELGSVQDMALKFRFADPVPFTSINSQQLSDLLAQLSIKTSDRKLQIGALMAAVGNIDSAVSILGNLVADNAVAPMAARILKLVAGESAVTFYDFTNILELQDWTVLSGSWTLEDAKWKSQSGAGGEIQWNVPNVSAAGLRVIITFTPQKPESALYAGIAGEPGAVKVGQVGDEILVVSSIGTRSETRINNRRKDGPARIEFSITGNTVTLRTSFETKNFEIQGLDKLTGDLKLWSEGGPLALENILIQR